jgi:hypothetical protein
MPDSSLFQGRGRGRRRGRFKSIETEALVRLYTGRYSIKLYTSGYLLTTEQFRFRIA